MEADVPGHSLHSKPQRVVVLDIDALQRARLARGMCLREVAQLAGISARSAYRAFKTGDVGVRVAKSLAMALDLDLATLWLDGGPAGERRVQPGARDPGNRPPGPTCRSVVHDDG